MVIWNKTKIVATVGPASNNRTVLRNMLRASADVLRINGAHGTMEEHIKTIRLIRSVARKESFSAAVLLDLPGPKIRVGKLKRESINLKLHQAVVLNAGQSVQTDASIPVPFRQIVGGLKKGSRVFLNDGMIELSVTGVKGNKINCVVKAGGQLRSNKGINLPDTKLNIPSLTPKDRKLLDMAIKEGVDYIGLSFVRSAKDVIALKRILKKRAPHIGVISKIEKPEAVENIDDIIKVSDAIMVARGDLGIEIPYNKVPIVQKDILMKCHIAGKPAITATQMLESMVNSKRPTRAEATDVANAVWEGTDAVMLSEETSMGISPAGAVDAMAQIAHEAEMRMPELPPPLAGDNRHTYQSSAISQAANLLADILGANAIVTPTRSGRTALAVSKQRPSTQILAPTEDEQVARRMALYWGVRPLHMKVCKSVDDTLKAAEKISLRSKFIKRGDTIVITSGSHGNKNDITRLVEIRQVS